MVRSPTRSCGRESTCSSQDAIADSSTHSPFVHPGANVQDIGLAYDGADALSIDTGGNLRISTSAGVLTDTRPETYQMVGDSRIGVESHFVLRSATTFGLAVGAYDPRLPLVIDPGLVYSTYLGGSTDDNGLSIAIDAAGNAYVTGFTASSNFPTTTGAYDTGFNGGQDVFVTKLNPSGTTVLYSTYIGGSSNEQGLAIAVDGSGNAYVTGFTGSTNFPTKFDPAQIPPGTFVYRSNYQGGSTDAFVTKLNSTGMGLVFSTFVGGSGADQGWGIAVHSSGDIYVTGDTTSSNLPVTPAPFRLQSSLSGSMDAFFLRLDRFAAAAAYMTYIGGSGADSARAIAIDANRNVYLTGGTTSSNYPTVTGSFDTTANGNEDAFATKLTYGGSTTVGGVSYDTYTYGYSTYLGGSTVDRGLAITIDASRAAYVTGITSSTNFPVTAGAFATSYGGGAFDGFVTKINPNGTAPLVYSTYLGGTGDDRGQGIALDSANDAHVAGRTASSNFPTTPGAFDTSYNGGDDAFVTKLNPTGSPPLLYSTFLGGSSGPSGNNDRGMAIAVDSGANAYITGLTASSNFPTTAGAYDTIFNGTTDAFVTKLDMIGAAYTMTLTPASATNQVGNPHTVTATVRDFAGRPVPGVTVRFSVTGANSASGTGSSPTNASGQATFTYTGTVAGPDAIAAYADTNNNGTQNAGEPTAAATKIWTAGPAATLTLAPATDSNSVGTQHCVTATVKDAFGNPVPGIIVRFSVPTAVATAATPSSGSASTNAAGQAQFCYSAALPGTDAIHAYADKNNNAGQDLGEPLGDATKIWTPPASTAFCEVTITNGGWIVANNGDRATFGGNAKVSNDGSAVQGHEQYQDQGPAARRTVTSINLLATTCNTSASPKTATIYGRARVDGAGNFVFRIDVTDGGTGGSTDSYGMLMSEGYASGQHALRGGNVDIHKS
jgi:protocatechuate 3,4-dioxygenase beta subunit